VVRTSLEAVCPVTSGARTGLKFTISGPFFIGSLVGVGCRLPALGPSLGRYSRYAKATFRKDRRLNIRLSSKDLEAIQKRALAEGLPYQTLISSLLHKYASGRLKEV